MALDINRPEGTAPDPEGLTPPERRFMDAFFGPAKYNATRAAQTAGYASRSRGALRVSAHRLLHRPRVRAALRTREARERSARAALAVFPQSSRTKSAGL